MSFELLSEPIRKFIRDKGWENCDQFKQQYCQNYNNGRQFYFGIWNCFKSKAAFFQFFQENFNDPGVQVLYISPLIALINDQFYRIEELCKI